MDMAGSRRPDHGRVSAFIESRMIRLRIGLVAYVGVTAAMMLYAGAFSLNAAVRAGAPELIMSVLPEHRLAALTAWDQAVIAQPATIASPTTRSVARAALAIDPLNARALILLATERSAAGDGTAAARLAGLSEQVSRRDVLAQFFLIEQAVRSNDVAGALRHYDIAIRTNPDSARLLYDTLGAAGTDPEIRAGLRPYVQAPAPWMAGFLFQLSDKVGGAQTAAALLEEANVVGRPGPLAGLLPPIIARLVDQGHADDALRLATAIPGFDAASLKTIDFADTTRDPRIGPLGWVITDAGASRIGWSSVRDKRALDVSIVSAQADDQVLMRRVVALAPGPYRLQATVTQHDGNGGAPPLKWRMSCLGPAPAPPPLWDARCRYRAALSTQQAP